MNTDKARKLIKERVEEELERVDDNWEDKETEGEW